MFFTDNKVTFDSLISILTKNSPYKKLELKGRPKNAPFYGFLGKRRSLLLQFYEQLLTKMSFYHSYQISMSLELQFIVKNIVFNQKLAILAPIKVPKMLKNFKFCENWEFQNLFCAVTGKKLIFWVRQLNKISKLGWNTTYTTNFRLIYR